ncbi:hypothetical protein HHK36_013263 [Tetracentron sinense]|uniref:Membrane-associated 30 kDa protein n=1 Tax=Tetracentron sinense TaxID=13715 RepID=A0A834Z692_TETSI|nr:hypothetical protein HHK36_013263 [Tetracentron sinense]
MAMKAPITGLSLASSPSSSLQASSNRLVVVRRTLKTSFFNGGVGALKVPGIRISHTNRSRCSGHGGGALGTRMNLFDRFARVVKSYANAIVSSFEDPEKILEQTVLEMNDDLTKMRQATAQVLASQKQLENRCKAAQQASEDWYRRAQLALGKGDEDLAREALKRRKSYANANGNESSFCLVSNALKETCDRDDDVATIAYVAPVQSDDCQTANYKKIEPFAGKDSFGRQILLNFKKFKRVHCGKRNLGRFFCENLGSNMWDNASALKAQLDQQKSVVENLVSNTRLLESKIQEAKSKKDTLKARAQSAKTASKVSEMLGNVNTSSALSAFEKMEEKVLAMESQAEALGQLTSDDLEGKFALLESSSVDDDLASLKKELSGSSKKGELPPGRTVSSSNAAFPFRDTEIEKELNELRRRANDF